jgi:polysaccharide export outer membrane protein
MRKILLLILSICFLSGCSSTDLLQEIDQTTIQPTPRYLIGIGDQLQINVWKNPDLSLSVPVRPDGKISVPLVGDAQAAGLSAETLAVELTDKLTKFIRTPEVTVIIISASSAEYLTRIRITGAVQNPQSIPYRKGMTILDLVLQAGSLTTFADGDNAILYRKTEQGTNRYSIKLNRMIKKGDISTNYELNPSDILIVPESIF